jgi:hypothetical protein
MKRFRKSLLCCLISLAWAGQSRAESPKILERTSSPDRSVALGTNELGDYVFVDLKSRRSVGAISAAEERSNIAFVTSFEKGRVSVSKIRVHNIMSKAEAKRFLAAAKMRR